MKIATYNVRDLFDERVLHSYGREFLLTPGFVQQRIDALATTIKAMDADIVAIQEVGSERVLRAIAEKTGLGYSVFIATPDQRGIANAVLYKYPGVCSAVMSLSSLPVFVDGDEDVYGERLDHSKVRDFIQVESSYAEKPLHIFGIHLKSANAINKKTSDGADIAPVTQLEAADGLIRSRLYQFSQARNLRQKIDTIVSSDVGAQIIVLGDFNTEANDDCMKIIKGHSKKLSGILTNACDEIPENKKFSYLGDGRKRLIDHVLLSESLKKHLVVTTVFNEHLTDQTIHHAPPLIVESDHAAISIELQ